MTPKKILVVDIEATCWEGMVPDSDKNRNEIIEIGITPIDIATKQIEQSRSILVIPPTTKISDFCTRLTTITPEMIVKDGVEYHTAIDILIREYRSEKNIFASWGDYDRKSFVNNCSWNRAPYPFGNMHLNVKALFAATFGFSGGMIKCMNHMKLAPEGTHHRGDADSRNIARILTKIIK